MTHEQADRQTAGLRRRIEILEAENRKLLEAVRFTLRTIDLCKDKAANPLAKMCDRATAERMLGEAAGVTQTGIPQNST